MKSDTCADCYVLEYNKFCLPVDSKNEDIFVLFFFSSRSLKIDRFTVYKKEHGKLFRLIYEFAATVKLFGSSCVFVLTFLLCLHGARLWIKNGNQILLKTN